MTHRATLRLRLDGPAQAERLARSLAPENETYLRARLEGDVLVAEAESATPMGLLRTLDEVLAALAAAQKAERLARRESA